MQMPSALGPFRPAGAAGWIAATLETNIGRGQARSAILGNTVCHSTQTMLLLPRTPSGGGGVRRGAATARSRNEATCPLHAHTFMFHSHLPHHAVHGLLAQIRSHDRVTTIDRGCGPKCFRRRCDGSRRGNFGWSSFGDARCRPTILLSPRPNECQTLLARMDEGLATVVRQYKSAMRKAFVEVANMSAP
jgi:hypothetical protein